MQMWQNVDDKIRLQNADDEVWMTKWGQQNGDVKMWMEKTDNIRMTKCG